MQEVRRGKANKRCGRLGKCPQETAIGSPLKKSRLTCLLESQLQLSFSFLMLFCRASSAAPFRFNFKMGTSLEPVNALKSRALEVALSSAEANALETVISACRHYFLSN